MPGLMGLRNVLVLNDEAHHCYREKPAGEDEEELKGDERKEAEKANKAARLWISGLEAVNRKLGISRVMDLSATPFFLRGSGYAEGTLFPWASHAEGFHLHVLLKPCVNLSIHTASDVRPPTFTNRQ
jgi:type III restriction enzyme